MLFEFGKFWKSCGVLGACWTVYLVFGYEFAMVSMVAILLSNTLIQQKN
tara:strand:- start:3239 stop:3385 length:147 start_codon:yes stop_codon:yes gene_type:complete